LGGKKKKLIEGVGDLPGVTRGTWGGVMATKWGAPKFII